MGVGGASRLAAALLVALLAPAACGSGPAQTQSAVPAPIAVPTAASAHLLKGFPVPAGSAPHDVAPAADGGIWFTAQAAGYLGHLDPRDGSVIRVPLGQGSKPHGVITGPDGAAWVTDNGQSAIVRVDATTREVSRFRLPAGRHDVELNTAAIGSDGSVWFTAQRGLYGRLDPRTGAMQVHDAPGGAGPYGMTATPDGTVYYASFAGSHIARVDPASGGATVIHPPTPNQGARRIWSDAQGLLWVSEWNVGQLARYDPATGRWREWRLPGKHPHPYGVYVDGQGTVWLSDWGGNQILSFDPEGERWTAVPLPGRAADVRQLAGRPGEVMGAAQALDRLLVLPTSG